MNERCVRPYLHPCHDHCLSDSALFLPFRVAASVFAGRQSGRIDEDDQDLHTSRNREDFGVIGGGHCPEPVVQVCVVSRDLGLYSGLAVTVIVVTKYRVPGYQSRRRTQDQVGREKGSSERENGQNILYATMNECAMLTMALAERRTAPRTPVRGRRGRQFRYRYNFKAKSKYNAFVASGEQLLFRVRKYRIA